MTSYFGDITFDDFYYTSKSFYCSDGDSAYLLRGEKGSETDCIDLDLYMKDGNSDNSNNIYTLVCSYRNVSTEAFDAHMEIINNAIGNNTKQSNDVHHPKHYNQGSIECIDAMLSAFTTEEVMAFCKLNAFKYIWRANNKGKEKDAEKAQWYINKYIELSKKEKSSL